MDTRVVEVNAPVFYKLTPWQKKMVLGHEEGHVVLDTVDDEIAADRYSIEKFAGSEAYSLRKMVDEMIVFFNRYPQIPESRKKAFIVSALEVDAERFGNEHAAELARLIKDEPKFANVIDPVVLSAIIAAVVVAVQTIIATMFGKRGEWFRGDLTGKKETNHRKGLIDDACDLVASQAVKMYSTNQRSDGGEGLVKAYINQDNYLLSKVHLALCDHFQDCNVITPSFYKSQKNFYKKCGWAKNYVLSKRERMLQVVRDFYAGKGYKDPEKSSSGSGLSWVLVAAAAIAVFLFLKKR
ncbi:MAG: hypothetical protein NC324_02300 [Bacteroides sp.]|nr:hypothetical protein [Bacteroides sp.]